jgi:CheY-like chemotaxis protein
MPGETILVAEDNAVEREGLAVVLRQRGYTVRTACDGAEALKVLQTGPSPGLILLDMLMPGCDGWQFLDRRKPSPAFIWERSAKRPVNMDGHTGLYCLHVNKRRRHDGHRKR